MKPYSDKESIGRNYLAWHRDGAVFPFYEPDVWKVMFTHGGSVAKDRNADSVMVTLLDDESAVRTPNFDKGE